MTFLFLRTVSYGNFLHNNQRVAKKFEKNILPVRKLVVLLHRD